MNARSSVHRFSSKKRVVATLGVTAMALTAAAAGASAAQAATGPTNGTFSEWSWSSFTTWQTDQTPPADPDGVDAPDDPSNLVQIGEGGPGAWPGVFVRTVPGAPTTETSEWVQAMPAGEGWVQVDQKTVIDVPESTTIVKQAHWQRYSWTGGPRAEGSAPTEAPPSENWQANVEGDPHGIGQPGAYFRSNGNSGNGDWFYLQWVPAEVEHSDAVSHEVFQFQRTTPGTTTTEYRWSVYERSFTPASGSSTEPGVVPGKGSTDVPSVKPTVTTPTDAAQPQESAAPQAVPTSIDAGL